MRSDSWDKKEKEPFHGLLPKDPKDCNHSFDIQTGKCCLCLKTREQLRKEWK